jgi:hypothetical protein
MVPKLAFGGFDSASSTHVKLIHNRSSNRSLSAAATTSNPNNIRFSPWRNIFFILKAWISLFRFFLHCPDIQLIKVEFIEFSLITLWRTCGTPFKHIMGQPCSSARQRVTNWQVNYE